MSQHRLQLGDRRRAASAISISGTCTTSAPASASSRSSSPGSSRVVTTRRPSEWRIRRCSSAGDGLAGLARRLPRRREIVRSLTGQFHRLASRRRQARFVRQEHVQQRRRRRRHRPAACIRRRARRDRPARSSPPGASARRRSRPARRPISRSPIRHSTATHPWPTAGTKRVGSSTSSTRSVMPSTSSAASAITIAPPSGTRSRRVGDVAAQLAELEVGPHEPELRPPPHRSGRHRRAVARARRACRRSARRRPSGERGTRRSRARRRRWPAGPWRSARRRRRARRAPPVAPP